MRLPGVVIGIALLASFAMAGAEWLGNPVYPAGDDSLRFSHLLHEHTACEHCHPGVSDSFRPAPLSLAGHSMCVKCHPDADEGAGKTASCRQCHRSPPGGRIRRAASLRFSHRLHGSAPESCLTCHVSEQEDEPSGMLPSASRCAECHADMMRSRCDACHKAGQDGRLITRLSGGRLIPTGGHGGDDHGPGWQALHGRVARGRKERCQTCHTERSCDACHRGVLRSIRIHPADWELSHPGAARAGLGNCDRCHRSQSKCLACHRQSGVAESAASRPPNMRLHPEGYRDLHRVDARRNLKACTSCHVEKDCIRCHGTVGIGQGVRPHPAGFSRRCRLFIRRNKRPCLKCHSLADLESRCP